MAVCPKCGRKLKLTDIKPTCPGCGVNLLYYKIEERLEVDAINAELEHAKTQKRVDRAKDAMFGTPLAIVRLVLLVLVVGMFFVPLATFHAVGPYFDKTTTLNALEIYNSVSSLDFDGMFVLAGSPVLKTSFMFLAISAVTIVVSVLCALLELIFSFLSSSPHGFSRNITLASVGIVSAVASLITYKKFLTNIESVFSGIIDGSVKVGIYLVIAAFVLCIVINIIIKVKHKPVKYKDTYVDSVPYEVFVEKFGIKKYDMESLNAIKSDMEQYKVVEE